MLVAQHDGDFALQVGIPHHVVGVFGCGAHPEALFLQALDGLHDVGNLRHGHVRDGARRAFVRGRLNARAALVGNDQARCAHRFAAAADGAQVARVSQMVAQHHQRAAVVLFGVLVRVVDDLADARVVERGGLGHDSLMAATRRLLVKLRTRNLDDFHAIALRFAHDVFDHGVALHVVAHKDAAHGHAGAERLDNGALALDVISHEKALSFFVSSRCIVAGQAAARRGCDQTQQDPHGCQAPGKPLP